MLLLHEVHTVVGSREDEFEAAFREGWLPALAETDDARLCWFLFLAHGTGRAYQVTTITALRDGAAYERLAERVQTGDLRAWAADIDHSRHAVAGKLLLFAEWSPMRAIDLATVPVDGRDHEQTLYMEDSAWPNEGMLDAYLEAAHTHYAPSLEHRTVTPPARRGVPGCAGCAAATRGRAVAEGALARAAADALHEGSPEGDDRTGDLDARRAPPPRRLGEPAPAHGHLVATRLVNREPRRTRYGESTSAGASARHSVYGNS
jgi:hypothetical protein